MECGCYILVRHLFWSVCPWPLDYCRCAFFPFSSCALFCVSVPPRLALSTYLFFSLAGEPHRDRRTQTRFLPPLIISILPLAGSEDLLFLVKENSRGTPALITTLYSTRVSFSLSFCTLSPLISSGLYAFPSPRKGTNVRSRFPAVSRIHT